MSIRRTIYTLLILGMTATFGLSCSHSHDDHDGEHKDVAAARQTGTEAGHEDEITMSHEAIELAGIKTETVAPAPFSYVIKTGGRIQSPSGMQGVVTAKASGIVNFTNKTLATGTPVSAGQTLFTISSRGMEQSDGQQTAAINLQLAETELKRAEELVKDNLISKREYEKIRSNYANAKALAQGVAVRGATGAVGASSPVGGYITAVNVSQGQFVNQGDLLATVSQNRRLHLRADVSERQWENLGAITGANIVIPGNDKGAVDLSKLGFRMVSSQMPDLTQSHYVPVIMEFDNPGSLRNGSVVEVYLLSSPRNGVISLPKSAIIEELGQHFVFAEVHDHVYKRIPVSIGTSDGIRVEIRSGVKSGDKIVTEGVQSVRHAENGGKLPAGHSHNH